MSKKQKAYLKEENLLTLLSQNNFIIPEIQREYVWGNNEKVITKFLTELKTKIGEGCKYCNLPENNTRINIGFLYSYKPDYVKVQNDRFLDENLIDGQQRFTTLFLLAFYFSIKENKKNDFLSLIRYENISMSFDFKVRDLTKSFLLEFVDKTNSIEDLLGIENKTWFLKDYKNDLSINAMIKSLHYIQKIFYGKTRYYNHLLSNIVFWHFKTEVTSEGEELYITMNARGEDLADNEITKAALMLNGKDLFTSGKKWEEWQDFFWKNRDRNRATQSADFGFNSFINCIAGLENYLKVNGGEFSVSDVEELLTLDKIEVYINSFRDLIDKSVSFKNKYKYCQWIDNCFSEFWEILNKSDTDWFADYTDKNKGTEQNKMILFWSWLIYFKDINLNEIDSDEYFKCFRVLRFFYIRYKNYNRAVKALKQTVSVIQNKGIFDTVDQDSDNLIDGEEFEVNNSYRTVNEKLKYDFLNNLKLNNDQNLLSIESLIWEIEDHPLNIVGAKLKNINSSHLVEFTQNPTVDELTQIKDKFYTLFPIKEDGKIDYSYEKKISVLLLWYGSYWQKKLASYYWKYNFGDWERIVRDLDSNSWAFKEFFNEFKISKDLDLMYNTKVSDFDIDFNTTDELMVFRWYASKLKEKMWDQGPFIAIDHYNYKQQDLNFKSIKELVNYKGNFNGGSPQILSNLIDENREENNLTHQ